ncbi:MAG: hypothetical protein HGA97_10385 [Chlorobiaceae bacterium]|nr:hypothetical protein [Chlorobiaceae bacterium]
MSELSCTVLNPSKNGIQGWAMMLPVVGLPLGFHAVGGALVVGVGMIAAVAPVAVPAAVPLLFNVVSKGGLTALTGRLFSSGQLARSEKNMVKPVAEVTGKDAEVIEDCLEPVTGSRGL